MAPSIPNGPSPWALPDRLELLRHALADRVSIEDPDLEPKSEPQSSKPNNNNSNNSSNNSNIDPSPNPDIGPNLDTAPNPDMDPNPPANPDSTSHWDWDTTCEPIPDDDPKPAGPAAQSYFDASGLQIGDPAPPDTPFIHLGVIQDYPRRFIGKGNRARAAPWFEAKHQIFSWNLFYFRDPENPGADPYIFVPTVEFDALLRHINAHLKTRLSIPDASADLFSIRFGDHRTPVPRYLGHHVPVTHADHDEDPDVVLDINALVVENNRAFHAFFHSIPPPNGQDEAAYQDSGAYGREQLSRKLRLLRDQGWSKKEKTRYNKAEGRLKRRADMTANLKAALGGAGPGPNAVLVSIDTECLEPGPYGGNGQISEVGIAILDVAAAADDASRDWQQWSKNIRAHHLRVYEYSGLRNTKYVVGCPEMFKFGKSTFPREANLGQAVMAILAPYRAKNLVLVGHDVGQDVRNLLKAGINLAEVFDVHRAVDSQEIHQYWKRIANGTSLGNVLSDMGIDSMFLHNGGNDAYYTLQAVIALAFVPDYKE